MHRCLTLVTLLSINAISLAAEPVSIGSRRELFVDDVQAPARLLSKHLRRLRLGGKRMVRTT